VIEMIQVAIVYHSTYGHTETIAKAVAEGAKRFEGSSSILIPVADVENQWDILKRSDAIIFGTPTYMGSASAEFKKFMEASSKLWMEQQWKNKIAAGFTVSSSQSGDKLNTLIQLAVFAAQHSMIWVGTGLLPGNNSSTASIGDMNRLGSFLGAMAQANMDQGPDVAPPDNDRETASLLGKRVAEITASFCKG
jgi:NAD(P)H dehydrogenase (quinone)